MNAQLPIDRLVSSASLQRPASVVALPRQPHRERDFGVGYGSSSGYASPRRYVSQTPQRLFRCA